MREQDHLDWAQATGVEFSQIPEDFRPPYRDRVIQTLRGLGWVIQDDGSFPSTLPNGAEQLADPLHGLHPVYDGQFSYYKSRAFYTPDYLGGLAMLITDPHNAHVKRGMVRQEYLDISKEEVNEQHHTILLKGEL